MPLYAGIATVQEAMTKLSGLIEMSGDNRFTAINVHSSSASLTSTDASTLLSAKRQQSDAGYFSKNAWTIASSLRTKCSGIKTPSTHPSTVQRTHAHALSTGCAGYGYGSMELQDVRSRPALKVPPPTGDNVTLACSDISNADVLWEFDPLAMRDATVLHNHTLRTLLLQHRGYEASRCVDPPIAHEAVSSLHFPLLAHALPSSWSNSAARVRSVQCSSQR
jgi:hypothetical protein